uniref:Secreted protein n=1 Tax=Steinernema glaseri TaxID=37863 RepID=A0A1I7ZUV6_9BILA
MLDSRDRAVFWSSHSLGLCLLLGRAIYREAKEKETRVKLRDLKFDRANQMQEVPKFFSILVSPRRAPVLSSDASFPGSPVGKHGGCKKLEPQNPPATSEIDSRRHSMRARPPG